MPSCHFWGGRHCYRCCCCQCSAASYLDRGQLKVELVVQVLVVAGKAQVAVAADLARGGLELADEQLEQRRLAGTVGADKREPRVEVQTKVEVLGQEREAGRAVVRGRGGCRPARAGRARAPLSETHRWQRRLTL